MKLKHFFAAALAVSVAFASCSKEESTKGGGNNETADSKEMFIQIGQAAAPASRAVGQPSGGVDVEFKTGTIIFTLADGKICNVVNIVETGEDPANGKVTVQQLKDGTRVGLISSDAKDCYLYANTGSVNVASKAIVNNNISTIHAEKWNLGTLNSTSLKDIPLYGTGKVEEGRVTIDGKLTDVMKSSFKVYPITARIQLAKLSGDNTIKSFDIVGIYINNYFFEMNADMAPKAADIFYNGIVLENYAANTTTGSYKETGHSIMLDEGKSEAVDAKTYIASDKEGDVWGYNVLPNYKLTRAELPHIIIKLDNVTIIKDGSDYKYDKPQFLTVRGYNDGTKIEVLEGGKSYTLTNLSFDKDKLGDRPEDAKLLEGFVTIEVNNWTNQDVTGEWN